MKKVTTHEIFQATITIGLKRNYTQKVISEASVLGQLQKLQNKLIEERKVYLSANCFPSTIVLSRQREPHLNLQFINYPKFILKKKAFKEAVEIIAEQLMNAFDQNRIVIQFHDSNVMLEHTSEIDPLIKK